MVARAALLRSWTVNSSACAARLEKPLHSTKAINALTADYLEIIRSQHHRAVGLGLFFEILMRRALLNCFPQSLKLTDALLRLHVTPSFKIIHRRSADRAQNHFVLTEHRELRPFD